MLHEISTIKYQGDRKMKVLWFEVTEPSRYRDNGLVIGGWQDSLENIVKECPEIELYIAFETNGDACKKNIDNVTYIPMSRKGGILEKIRYHLNENKRLEDLKIAMKQIVDDVNPDLIHVFGTEWPYGHVADVTDKPVVIHIMGSLVPYANSFYPPGISFDMVKKYTPYFKYRALFSFKRFQNWVLKNKEEIIWKKVKFYMGRTEWDQRLSSIMSPGRKYFHVEEALRHDFVFTSKTWSYLNEPKIKLVSTGCSTFWKGPDMLLKTAKILKNSCINFEWIVAGKMNSVVKAFVEKKLGTTFEENNVKLVGFTKPSDLCDILCQSTMYVHTAYAENSPNSICEAQILGVPVVSTYVGGISTLLGDDGIMVPANDPWQMACAIIELAKDKDKLEIFSKNGRKKALKRHNPQNIEQQLLNCYKSIIGHR